MTEEECDAKLVELIGAITGVCSAINNQTTAINALVESNQRLIMMMAEGMVDEDVQQTTYMDGSKV